MRARRFHHVRLMSGHADRTRRFYCDVLGLHEASQDMLPQDAGTADSLLLFGDADLTPGSLLLFEEHRGHAHGSTGAGGVHHVAFGTVDQDAQLRWKRWLTDHDVPVSGPFNRGWFHSIYFTDPDGQILEIATKGPGYALDEEPTALGERVVVPPGAELRGKRDEVEIRQRTWSEPVSEVDASMRLDGIHHISNITDDVEAMDRFIVASLGLRLVKRSVNQDDASMPHWFWANYDGQTVTPHSALTMFGPWPAGGYPVYGRMKRAVPGVGQAAAIAFDVENGNLDSAWIDRLIEAGADVMRRSDEGLWATLGFRAPDGMNYELVV